MNNDNDFDTATIGAKSRTRTILIYAGQSGFFVILALVALVLIQQFPQASIPIAPTEVYFVAYGLFALVALLHFPAWFFRFSNRIKRILYALAIVSFIFLASMSVTVIQAYQQSPEGQKAAADAIAWEKEYADILAQNKKDDARMAELIGKAETEKGNFEAVEACFSTFGKRLPEFERQVKEFRAENGFGGTRTARAYAKISTDSCKVISLKLPD